MGLYVELRINGSIMLQSPKVLFYSIVVIRRNYRTSCVSPTSFSISPTTLRSIRTETSESAFQLPPNSTSIPL